MNGDSKSSAQEQELENMKCEQSGLSLGYLLAYCWCNKSANRWEGKEDKRDRSPWLSPNSSPPSPLSSVLLWSRSPSPCFQTSPHLSPLDLHPGPEPLFPPALTQRSPHLFKSLLPKSPFPQGFFWASPQNGSSTTFCPLTQPCFFLLFSIYHHLTVAWLIVLCLPNPTLEQKLNEGKD